MREMILLKDILESPSLKSLNCIWCGTNDEYEKYKTEIKQVLKNKYLVNDYENTIDSLKQENIISVEKKAGYIASVYMLSKRILYVRSFLWIENDKQIIKTFVDLKK